MSQILATRAAIVERLGEIVDPIPVEIHPRATFDARFVEEALKNCHLKLLVSFLGNPREDAELSDDEMEAPFEWAVFIAAKDGHSSKLRRDELILEVLPVVLLAIAPNATLPCELKNHAPKRIRSSPVHEGEVGNNSAMVWGVVWSMTCSLLPKSNEDLRPFLQLITKYDLAPKDGVIDATDVIVQGTTT